MALAHERIGIRNRTKAAMTFTAILEAAQKHDSCTLAIGLAPSLKNLPYSIQSYDDPFLPLGKAIIDATHELVCAYVFDLAAYLALGAAGAVALERTIAYVPGRIVKILHGPFATGDYAQAAFEEAFNVDAVTLIPTLDRALIAAYLEQSHHGAIVNMPPKFDVQELMRINEDYPGQIGLYREVAPDQNVLGVLYEPYPEVQWYSQHALYSDIAMSCEHEYDFRSAIHQAALELCDSPTQAWIPKPDHE
jgi:hypothetical protein